MITIEHGAGGLYLSRWNGTEPRPESFFVPSDELAGVIARLIQEAGELDDAAAWDVQAWLAGNPMTALA